MIKLGMLIGDRYEILDKIGTGGMSDVYKAKDQKLNRFVAVKVLKQEFSENKNFVSKFRVEAQAAAGLMHPNIVNVYDVGEEDGIHYIVMELVEGITLKKYIEKKVRLTTKEAISIAIQVAMGIEAAHNNHIIHRDIKPQNIIISKEGKVKVTDFGIAKAASSNTITSNVMGSVHYTSPEQARGGFSDAKSDIYSMGITFFEMLTGRVPFNGDTTVSIAIKNIQDVMPSPKEFVPEIPVSVEKIVLKCTQKSPDRRYQSMEEMIRDLKHSLINPDEDFVQLDTADDAGKTRVVADVRSNVKPTENTAVQDTQILPVREEKVQQQESYENREELQEIRKKRKSEERGSSASKKNGKKQHANQSKPVKKAKRKGNTAKKKEQPAYQKLDNQTVNRKNIHKSAYDEDMDYTRGNDEYDYNPKMESLTTVLTVIAAVVIGCILLYFAGKTVGIFGTEQSKEEQQSQQESQVMTEEAGERVTTGAAADSQEHKVPDVVGLSEAEGTAKLKNEGFRVNKVEAYSTEYEKGYVIGQTPEGNTYSGIESEITIEISKGAERVEVRMPQVLGYTQEAAVSTLEAAGLVVGKIDESYSSEYPAGQICYQSFASGTTVDEETKVDLKISIGSEIATYSCEINVQAPMDYIGGNAEVILTTADFSEQLWYSQNVTSFPVSIKLSGFTSSSAYGIVTISYLKNVEEIVTDSDGNQTIQMAQAVAQTQQNVQFVKE